MGRSTKSYPNMPQDIMGLRKSVIQGLQGGQIRPPSYQPTYRSSTATPSYMTRAQAMSQPNVGRPFHPPGGSLPPFPTQPLGDTSRGGSRSGTPQTTLPMFTGPMANSQSPQTQHPVVPRFAPGVLSPDREAPDRNGILGLGNTLRDAGRNTSTRTAANQGNVNELLRNIFPEPIDGPPPVNIPDLPGLDFVEMGNVTPRFDPRMDGIIDQLIGGAGNMSDPAFWDQFLGGNAGAAVQGLTGNYQTLDQILNPQAEFYKQITGTFGDAFKQNRSLALAQAKEGAGNLTGSGLANTLGTTVNRSLADEQKAIMEALLSSAGVELGRQTQHAGLENQRNIATADNQTEAGIAAQQMRLQGLLSGRRDLIELADLMDSQGQNQANREQQTNSQNADTENRLNTRYFDAGVDRNRDQADMDLRRFLAQYGGAISQTGQASGGIQELLRQLLGGGVGPNTIVDENAWWEDLLPVLGPIIGLL